MSGNSKKDRTSGNSKMGPIGCPETSVPSYHSALRNLPEELRFFLNDLLADIPRYKRRRFLSHA